MPGLGWKAKGSRLAGRQNGRQRDASTGPVPEFMNLLRILPLIAIAAAPVLGAETDIAATAVNALGLDLHRQLAASGGNTCLSPYSIQISLAMAYAGASGTTRDEMARVLHYPDDEAVLDASLAALNDRLAAMQVRSERLATQDNEEDEAQSAYTFHLANRLYGQKGFEFRPEFVALLGTRFRALPEALDFARDPEMAAAQINDWVTAQTHNRILDLVAPGDFGPDARIMLVSALYLKASWSGAFDRVATKRRPFYVSDQTPVDVPTLHKQHYFGYRRLPGFSAVTLPYRGGALQFLVLVPDAKDGLTAVEANLTQESLREFASLPARDVDLYLPKFKLQPAAVQLSAALELLGMKTAFDRPRGSADFDRMAPQRAANGYLYISAVFHKTFIAIDESGTEAAAASSIALMTFGVSAERPTPPIVVRVDRPFFYAIQDVSSGACLFMGRVVDPR